LKSSESKKVDSKVKSEASNILSIKYLIFIKGRNICSKDVNSGFPNAALLPLPLAPPVKI
tara:strand:- start:2509 stop:2688 length:180 start_codon:yes stop_codon:yes gene_type:complete